MTEELLEKINGKRTLLKKQLPLKQPFSMSITVSNVCNLKCEFCDISRKDHKKNKAFLEFNVLKRCVDSMVKANWHLKQIVLVGLGEPLLNKNIVQYVKYIKDSNVTDKIHLVTNGTLLPYEISDRLIEAGVDVLRISINGLSAEDYMKYTGVKIDFDKIVDGIKYFYEHKKENTRIYIKIMDYMVDTPEKLERFNKIFTPISDVTNIEYLTQMSTSIDYENHWNINDKKGLKGFDTHKTNICPLSFYHTYLNAEGTISACCIAGPWYTPPALVMGDLHRQEIDEIWNGEKFRNFWLKMLREGKDCADPVCKKCKAYMSYIYPEDVIDDEAERIAEDLENNRLK